MDGWMDGVGVGEMGWREDRVSWKGCLGCVLSSFFNICFFF